MKKILVKSFLGILVAIVMLVSGFPLDRIFNSLADSKIIDNLYIGSTSAGNIVDKLSVQQARASVTSPSTRVRTVEFFAGQYQGSATNQNQNAKQDFTAQTFSLAESSVDIIDAYVEFSAEIGGTTATTYTASILYFDACTPSCTPSTAAFTTTAGLGTNSGEAQTIRMRASVTSEAEIAAYTGAAASRSFQVSYCFISSGSTCSGTAAANIQSANAKLVLTYTYDPTSSTQTNTVIYPLESSSGVGSKIAAQASCTINSTCPLLAYNADIPEISSQVSQFFYLQTSINASSTTDFQLTPQVDGNASGSAAFFEEALSNNGGWFNSYASGLTGYANNSSQNLELGTNASNAYLMGGEDYVTYTYSNAAATKTRTVVYPVGEVQTAGSTNKTSLIGPTVYFGETGVSVKKAWFRVHTSIGAANVTSTNLLLTTKVGGNAETGSTTYAVGGESQGTATNQMVSDDGYFIHMVPSADYTALNAATADAGVPVQMTADWATARGAVSAELVITYQYTGEADGFVTSQTLFAGQQTAAGATTFSTSTGAVNPYIVTAGSGATTVLGASVKLSAKDTSSTANQTLGINLTTSTCSASNTSTTSTDSEITRVMLWKSISGIVTNNDATTYTACYSSSQASIFTGILTVTTLWDGREKIDVSSTGSQTSSIIKGSTTQYVGAVFAIGPRNTNSANVTSITITENGTVNAQTNLDNIKLYYENDTTSSYNCASESYAGTETQYGSTDTDGFTGANGTVTFTGSVAVTTTSTMCAYVVLDVSASAGTGDTLELEITNPSTDIVASTGVLGPTTVVALSGTTTITAPPITVSGSCVQVDGTTPCVDDGSNVIKIAVNGVVQAQTDTVVDGSWSISSVSQPNSGDVITIWVDNTADANEATAVTKYDGTGDIASIILIQSVLSIGSNDNTTISNTDLGQYDGDNDEDLAFTSNSGTLDSSGAILVLNGSGTTSSTYTPGGAVTALIFIQVTGTVNGGSATWSVGSMTQYGGTFTATSGTTYITGYNGNITISGGTFNHNSGTFSLGAGDYATINTGSAVFNNIIIDKGGCCGEVVVTGTWIIAGNLTVTNLGTGGINGGTIELSGDLLTTTDHGMGGAVVKFVGAGTQNVSASGDTGGIPTVWIAKPSGTINFADTINIGGYSQDAFKYSSGTVNMGTSTIVFHGEATTVDAPTINFYNVNVNAGGCCGGFNITTSLSVTNDFTVNSMGSGGFNSESGVKTIVYVGGDLSVNDAAGGGVGIDFELNGTGSQTISLTDTSLPTGSLTINKTSGTATLVSNLVTSGDLIITQGTLDQGATYSLTVNGSTTVSASGVWSNTGTGDVTLGGDVSNAGTITLDSLGNSCGDADDIVLTSTNTTARTWSGAGIFQLYDLTVSYMSGTITAYSSTDGGNNSSWIFSSCGGVTISGTVYSGEGSSPITNGPTVRIKVNGAGSYTATANGSGVYSIGSVSVLAGSVITVYLDGATPDAVTVTRAVDNVTDITGLDLYQNYLIISHEDSGPVTNTNLGQYDSDNDPDILFSSNSGTLTMNSATTLYISSGKTFSPSGSVNASALKILGTYDNATSNPSLTVGGDFTINSGATFTKGTGAVTLNKSGTQTFTDSTAGQDLGDVRVSGNIQTTVESWWNVSWTARRKVIFNNGNLTSSLTDFPVLISLNSSNIDYTKTQNSGQDIRFVDADGSTSLSYEIEKWDEAGTSLVWVKVPSLANNNTDYIWMYYGNAGASDAQAATSVWDSSFRGVWHMNNASSPALDSTSNNNDASENNGVTFGATGKIGSATSYGGIDDYLSVTYNSSLNVPSGISLSAWVKTASTGRQDIISRYQSSGPYNGYGLVIDPGGLGCSGDGLVGLWVADSNYLCGVTPVNDDQWHFIQGTFNGTTGTIYVDGRYDISGTLSANLAETAQNLKIGQESISGSGSVDGEIDEVRISDAARSTSWVQAEYRSANNEMATYQPEETQASTLADWCNISSTDCNSSWLSRRAIYLNNANASGSLTDFPLLVRLDSTNIDYSKTQNNGQDIRFVDADGSTALSYQIESWNESGSSYVWVKIPSLANNNSDYIWIYYNNGTATDNQAPSSVWNSNYKGVWHFSSDLDDSTSNNNDGSASGEVSPVSGVTGNSAEFDSGEYVEVASSSSLNTTSTLTWSVWIKTTASFDSTPAAYMSRADATSSCNGIIANIGNYFTNINFYGSSCAGNSLGGVFGEGWLEDGNWHQFTTTLSSTTASFYLDGNFFYSENLAGSFNFNSQVLRFAKSLDTFWSNYVGDLDEPRISNIVRDGSWINADYRSTTGSMTGFGREENSGAATIVNLGSNAKVTRLTISSGQTLSANGSNNLTLTGYDQTTDWCDISSTDCDTTWLSRRKITFSNSALSGSLTDFPVLVALDSSNIDYSKTQNSGQDIRFVDADGSTPLPYEIETWNESGTSYVWVQVPTLSNNNTDFIWIYYNNSSATDNQSATIVWDSSFRAVWHLDETMTDEGTGGSNSDSTSAANTITQDGNDDVAGKIGNGQSYDGNDYASCTDAACGGTSKLDMGTNNWTIEAWVKSSSVSASMPFSKTDFLCGGGHGWNFETSNTGRARATMGIGGTCDANPPDDAAVITDGTWHHVVVVFTRSGNMVRYVDGVASGSVYDISNLNGQSMDNSLPFCMGARCPSGASSFYTGSLDEVRISASARSADWIKAEYNSGAGLMNNFSGEESYTGPGVWYNDGTFTASTGTVTLAPTGNSVLITGASVTNFNNLSANAPGKTIMFKAGQTVGVSGALNLYGGPGNLLMVQSDTPTTRWNISFSGTSTLSFIGLIDAGCAGGTSSVFMHESSVSISNNDSTCWKFVSRGAGSSATEGGAGGSGATSGGGSGGGSGATSSSTLPETFTDSDGTALATHNSTWSILHGGFSINTNGVYSSLSQDGLAQWTAGNFNNNQYSQITLTALSSGNYIGTAVRTQDGVFSGYFVYTDSNTAYQIQKYVNGVQTILVNNAGTPFQAGDVLRLEISGTTLTLKRNGSVVTTTTDATFSSGRPGVAGNGTATTTRGDDWSAGDVATSGGGGGGGGGASP